MVQVQRLWPEGGLKAPSERAQRLLESLKPLLWHKLPPTSSPSRAGDLCLPRRASAACGGNTRGDALPAKKKKKKAPFYPSAAKQVDLKAGVRAATLPPPDSSFILLGPFKNSPSRRGLPTDLWPRLCRAQLFPCAAASAAR